MRQFSALESSQRIVHKQRSRFLLAKLFFDELKGRLEFQWTTPRIVSVARDDVNEPFGNPAKRILPVSEPAVT